MEIMKLIPTNKWVENDRSLNCPVCEALICLSVSELRDRKRAHQLYHENMIKLMSKVRR